MVESLPASKQTVIMANKYPIIVSWMVWIWHCLRLSAKKKKKGFGSVQTSVIVNSVLSQWENILYDQMLQRLATYSIVWFGELAWKNKRQHVQCSFDLWPVLSYITRSCKEQMFRRTYRLDLQSWRSAWQSHVVASVFLHGWINLVSPRGPGLLKIIIDDYEMVICFLMGNNLTDDTCQGLFSCEIWGRWHLDNVFDQYYKNGTPC